jgi:DNA methylase
MTHREEIDGAWPLNVSTAAPAEHRFEADESQPMRPSSLERIREVDWNFSDRAVQSELERIHPYPAKFIPELPGTLLDHFNLPSGVAVLDPFVGSGTTLVECQRRGIQSVGVDLNPIACLISRVKTSLIPQGISSSLAQIVDRGIRRSRSTAPPIPNLDHWFTEPVKRALANLTDEIAATPATHRDIVNLGLSSIIVRVSRQDSDTRYAAVDNDISFDQVFKLFEGAVSRIIAALESRTYPLTRADVIEKDTLALTPGDVSLPVGAIITSPPYPNAYEYWLYHKYRMWWLGLDPISVKQNEIGARAHFFKTNRHTAAHFEGQMRKAFATFATLLIPDAYAAFVMGRSKIHGEIVDNARTIKMVGKEFGFAMSFEAERTISAARKSFNLSHANIKTESVIVLRRSRT